MGLVDALPLARPRVLPHQVGHAEVMPGQAQYLPGSSTSRPPDAPVHPHQVGVAEVVPGQAQYLPGPSTPEPRVRPPQMGLAGNKGAVDLTSVLALSLGLIWSYYFGRYEVTFLVIFLFGRLLWTVPFGHLFM